MEISPEQLSAASTEAEISLLVDKKLSRALGLPAQLPLSLALGCLSCHTFPVTLSQFSNLPLRSNCLLNQNVCLFPLLRGFYWKN